MLLTGGVVGEVHGIATDSRPTATMSRARGPDCASSTPSMHHARDKPGVGHQWLPQHAAGVLLHERPDGRMRPSARGRTSACKCPLAALPTLSRWKSSVHMPATLAECVVHLKLLHWVVVQHTDWNHPKRPAEELTRTERWCPLSVAWKRVVCNDACSSGARWVEAAGGTPRTSRECACITWCSFSAGATNADTNAAPSPQRTRIVAERERVGFTRSHAYHRQAERARELCGAAAAAADRLLTCTARRTAPTAEVSIVPTTPPQRVHVGPEKTQRWRVGSDTRRP